MCGICGYYRKKHIDYDIFHKMNDSLKHRGPDDEGIWQSDAANGFCVGLAQRRLSILDLSANGHQPMLSDDGNYIISYNGEVYNFTEIRDELSRLGYSFKSDCDTEVILYAYVEWKEKCFSRFNGMFAIAIYSISDNKLILSRDRIGKKPLYYYWNGQDLVFASELKPIMLCPEIGLEIDFVSLGKYFCNKYIESPFTIYQSVYKVEPGTYISLYGEELSVHRYWNIIDIYNNSRAGELIHSVDDAKEQLRALIQDSVKMRLVADVPVGVFLSRGIDSSLVAAVAQSVSHEKIDTYTIGFYDKGRNEAPQAAKIAKYLGTNHHEYYIGEDECRKMLQSLPLYYDEPFSDSSQIPSMLVCELASKEITVALSGDGGDEPFCGYNMYDLEWIAQKLSPLAYLENKMPWNGLLINKLGPEARAFFSNIGDKADTRSQFFTDVRIEESEKILGFHPEGARYSVEKQIHSDNWQERRMLVDLVTYLPDEALAKMDRASMRSSLEVRCPLLDYRILEWSMKLSHSLKYHGFEKKYITKQLVYDYIPKELLSGPKNGFGVPMHKWLRTYLRDELLEYASPEYIKRQGIFDYKAVGDLIDKQFKSDKVMYSSVLWSYYVFQRWYCMYKEKNINRI